MASRQLGVVFKLVTVSVQTLASEASKQIDTDAVIATVVVFRLAALIEIFNTRNRIKWTRNVQVSTADIVGSCLDHFNQLVLDVTLDDLRPGIRVLLHLQGGVDGNCTVQGKELVNFSSHVDIGEGGESHGAANLGRNKVSTFLFAKKFDINYFYRIVNFILECVVLSRVLVPIHLTPRYFVILYSVYLH